MSDEYYVHFCIYLHVHFYPWHCMRSRYPSLYWLVILVPPPVKWEGRWIGSGIVSTLKWILNSILHIHECIHRQAKPLWTKTHGLYNKSKLINTKQIEMHPYFLKEVVYVIGRITLSGSLSSYFNDHGLFNQAYTQVYANRIMDPWLLNQRMLNGFENLLW